jgi:RNA polymerase sigma-70 factor (ECF subfamily)
LARSSAFVSATPSTPTPGIDRSRWFAEEVHVHDGQLKAYLRGSFPSVRDVEDVVQESYLRLWKRRATHPIECAKGFLFQVARRLAIDVLRRRESARTDSVADLEAIEIAEPAPDAADAAARNEELRLLAQAFYALPERCRAVMVLRKIEGLSQREIAARLGISEGTVQVQVGRGLRQMEEFFERLERRRRP